MQIKLTDFEKKAMGIRRAIKLAREKYRDDWAIQTWLKIYERGTADIVKKNGKKKEIIKGIEPHSEFAKRNLIRAIVLREEGKVRAWERKSRNTRK